MSSDRNNILPKQELEKARQAVARNMISTEQLVECIHIQSQLVKMGLSSKPLSEVLIEKGYIEENVWAQLKQDVVLQTDEGIEMQREIPSGGFESQSYQSALDQYFIDLEQDYKTRSQSAPIPDLTGKKEDSAVPPSKDTVDNSKKEVDSVTKESVTKARIENDQHVDPKEKTKAFEFSEQLLPDDVDFKSAKAERERWPQIGGYQILSVLGKGSMGTVYKAMQMSMQRIVAIKVLDKKLSENRELVERFTRETRAVAQLNHENIIGGIDAGKTADNLHYFVMEFIEGEPLSKKLEGDGKLSIPYALKITLQIVRAMQHAHSQGLIHRDIKPENIMITQDNIAKLCDLGLVKDARMDSKITMPGLALGTPHYISPEQARGEENIDIRSDIYSLGASLYHMVVGSAPFPQANATVVCMMHITKPLPSPRELNPDIPEAVCQIIHKCTEKDRDKRYQTPSELAKHIEKCLQSLPKQSSSMIVPKQEDEKQIGKNSSPGLQLLPLEEDVDRHLVTKASTITRKIGSESSSTIARKIESKSSSTTARKVRPKRHSGETAEVTPVESQEGSKTGLLIMAILSVMVVLGGVGYLIYPAVERWSAKFGLLSQTTQPVQTEKEKTVPKDTVPQELQTLTQELRVLTQDIQMDDNDKVNQRRAEYEKLLEKYRDNTDAVEQLQRERRVFEEALGKTAHAKYEEFLAATKKLTQQYQETRDPNYLKKAHDYLSGYPQAMKNIANIGNGLEGELGKLTNQIQDKINEDLLLVVTQETNKKYRESLRILERIANYALPSQLKEVQPIRERVEREYRECVVTAENRYGDRLINQFHHAVLQVNYKQAKKICEDYKKDEYYGLWESIDLLREDIVSLEQTVARFKKSRLKSQKLHSIPEETLLNEIPDLGKMNNSRRTWILGVLHWQDESWYSAQKYFQNMSNANQAKKIYMDAVQKKMNEQTVIAKWEEVQGDFNKQKSILARRKLQQIYTDFKETEFFKHEHGQMDEMKKKIDDIYLKRYAIPLYFSGVFSQIPNQSNHLAFSIQYPLTSTQEHRDFYNNHYGSQEKTDDQGWEIEFPQGNGLFEIYWKGKIKSFTSMSVTMKAIGPAANLGLALYRQEHPEKKAFTLNRYLYLLYFDAHQMCRSEIFNKAKEYWNYDPYQRILHASSPSLAPYYAVLCFTEGNAGTLPNRVDELVKARVEFSERETWTLSAEMNKDHTIRFDLMSCDCSRYKEGYFGLYANSRVIFSKLTISGLLDPTCVKEIEDEVMRNKTLYLERTPYWEEY